MHCNIGWSRKNARISITNFKEIGDVIKLVNAVISRTFFFQQNDYDEGVLMLEPFL